jgi:hypothetical protein
MKRRICAGLLLLTASALSHAGDKNRLWLPVKYQTLYMSLVKAASTAEELDRCESVVEGTLDLDQSTPDHPIFRILCRQESGLTYNEMVDGLSFVTLTTPPDSEEHRQIRAQLAWQQCRAHLVERTQLMADLRWLTDLDAPLEPAAITAEEVRFFVDFDAKSLGRESLRYRGECAVVRDKVEVALRQRP